jgi:hypothetical protein
MKTTRLARLTGRVHAAIAPRWRRVGPDGVRGDFPAGVGHAVPAGSTVALCGVTPQYVWNGDFNPRSRVVDPCPRCVELLPDSDPATRSGTYPVLHDVDVVDE